MFRTFTTSLAALAAAIGVALHASARDLYWSEYGGDPGTAVIKASDIDGSNETTIFEGTEMASFIVDIVATNTHLYWSGHSGGDVWRSNRDGSDAGRIVESGSGLTSVHNLVIDESAGKLYIACHANGIFSANLDGSDLSQLLFDSGTPNYSGIELRSSQEVLYVVTSNNQLYSFNPEDAFPFASSRTLEGGNTTYGLAYDDTTDTLHYTVWTGVDSAGSLYSINLDTGETVLLRPDLNGILGLKLSPDKSHLLVAQRGVGVGAVRLSDGGYELIADAPAAHFAVAVTANPELTDPDFPIDPNVIHDVVWTGATGDGDFGNPLNWDPERVPGFYDRAVFNSGATATIPGGSGITVAGILFDSEDPVLIDGITDENLLGINFRGGLTVARGHHTIFGTQPGNTSGGLRFVGVFERYIDIAEGASLDLDVRIRHIGTGLDGDPLLGGSFASGETGTNRLHFKTGQGTLIMSKDNGGSNSWNFDTNFFTVVEGTFRLNHPRATGLGRHNFRVLDGGTIDAPNGISLSTGTIAISGNGVGGNGALRATGSGSFSGTNPLVIEGEASVGVDDGESFNISRPIAGGVLSKVGDGTLFLGGANDHIGGTIVEAGTLVSSTANSLGTGPVSVRGGLLDLQQTPDLSQDPIDAAYALLWYPSEENGTVSHLRIQEGFSGAVLAEKEWGGSFPNADNPWDGIGSTYQLAGSGDYDVNGNLTLTFTLTDANGFSDNVSAVIESPLTGGFFGFGGRLDATAGRDFDFRNFSVTLGDAPGTPMSTLDAMPFTAPFTLDFGMSSGQSDGEGLVFNRPDDFLLQWDSLQLRAVEQELTTSTARALVGNYHPGQDFSLASDMVLTWLEQPGPNSVGFAVLGGTESIVSRISLDGGQIRMAGGLSYSGIGSTSPLGMGTSADFLSGSSPASQTLLDGGWSTAAGAHSDVFDYSLSSELTPPEIPPAPVSAWLFNGDFNDAFSDNHGTASGSPQFSSDVPSSLAGRQSLNLDDGEYLDMGLPANLRLPDEMSASAWIKTSQAASNRYVLGNYDTRNNGRVWAMIVNDGEFRVNISTDGSFTASQSGIYHSSADVNTGEWVHLAFTWKEGELRLFVNGDELLEGQGLVKNRPIDFTSLHDPDTSSVVIGRRDGGTVGGSQYIGLVAEPAIWNVALSPAEVAWVSLYSLSTLNDPEPPDAGVVFAPFVLSMEYAAGTPSEVIDDLRPLLRVPGGGSFQPVGTDFVGSDTPWSGEFNQPGQYGIDRERGVVWFVTDITAGSVGLFSEDAPPVGQSYEEWADAEGISAGERDPDLDRFGRGIPNLVAYITGISASDPQEPVVVQQAADGQFCFEVPLRADLADGAGFALFSSADLSDWEVVDGVDWQATPLGDGRSLMTVCLPMDLDLDRFFHRIVFFLNP